MYHLLRRLRDQTWRQTPLEDIMTQLESWDKTCREAADKLEQLDAKIDQLQIQVNQADIVGVP